MSVHRMIGQASRIVLIAGFGMTLLTSARAFEATAEQREACMPDAFRLCSSEIPDVGRITACMKANEANLSPRCRAVFQTARLDRVAPTLHRGHRAYAHYRQAHARHRWARS